MHHFTWTAGAVAVLFSVAACDSTVNPPTPPGRLDFTPWQLPALPTPAQVVVTLSTAEIAVGQSAHATAIASTEDGNIITGEEVSWSTEDSSIATVDNDGLVRGVAAGSSRIVASIGGTNGAAVVNIVTLASAPTVASVSVGLTRTLVNIGETAEAVATPRDAAGNVIAGQSATWTSSAPQVATVSPSGVVTAVSPGTTAIAATVGGASGEAMFFVAASNPPDFGNNSPSPGHPNEPAGFAQLSPTLSGDTIPLNLYGPTAAYELGWLQNNQGATQVLDADVPFASKKVLQANFPAGMIGGGSPVMVFTASSTNHQNWPQRPTAIYQSFWYKLSPNFPANLVANKTMYSNIGGGNKIALEINGTSDFGTQYTAPLWPMLALQSIVRVDNNTSGNAILFQNLGAYDPAHRAQVYRGQWHHIEALYVANTAGNVDGTVRLWLDGTLVIDYTNRVQWSATADVWQWTSWDPVYGGGGSVPTDAVNPYHRLKDLYVSGK